MKNENLISFENESRELDKIFDILKALISFLFHLLKI